EFVFIGPIPKEKQLDLPWVQYRGSVSDQDALKAELDQGDVLVCPSYSEGMPTVILEAMARGLAIVATDVGATCELVYAYFKPVDWSVKRRASSDGGIIRSRFRSHESGVFESSLQIYVGASVRGYAQVH
ncbi:MAG: glycosyltransferase family 4 protein, partial [Opitutales bacterium]